LTNDWIESRKILIAVAALVTARQHLPHMFARIRATQQANRDLLRFLGQGGFHKHA
jgi:hypothetical protein